jgi:sporulation protein YlmC with PRC-barrel domain
MSATAVVLSASLILAACGGGADDTTAPPADDAAISTPAVDDAAAEEDTAAEEDAVATPEEAEDTESSEVVDTESDVITDTEVTTETQVFTETDVVTDVDVTTVTTDTVVSTETEEDTETETLTDTEVITDTESETETGTLNETEGVTDTEGMTETGATETAAGAATDATGSDAAMMGVSGVDSQYVRASTLLDYDFENMGGEVSGDLEDLLIDLSTGRVLFAAIEYGGVLDLGDKDIVVPLNAFAVGPEGELVLNIDETALENYPDVGNDWPDLNDPAWDDDVNNFWSETGITGGTDFEEATTSVARASELMGHRVADLGAGAGSVLDILVNLGTGQAPYVIVDYGEGLDTDPYVLPISAFDVAAWNEELSYGPDFTPDMLETAPRFDQDAYPVGTPLDNDFGDNIESFWNDLGFNNDLNNDGQTD